MSEQKPENGKQQEEPRQEGYKTGEHSDRQRIISALEQIAEQNKVTEYQAKRADQFHRLVEKLTLRLESRKYWVDVSGVIGIFAAAAIAIWAVLDSHWSSNNQYKIMNRQVQVMQDQLDAATATQRPWIKVDIQFVGLRFAANGDAEIAFRSNYRNVGQYPAQNIQMRIVAAVVTEKTDLRSIDEEIIQCNLAAKDSATLSAPGIVLFPGEHAPDIVGGAGAGRAYVSATEYKKSLGGQTGLLFKLVGCIDYSLPSGSGRHGQTGFAYMISEEGTPPDFHEYFIKPVPNTSVVANKIMFKPDPFSSGYIK